MGKAEQIGVDELQAAIAEVELTRKRVELARSRLTQLRDAAGLRGRQKTVLAAEADFAVKNGRNLLKSASKKTNALLLQILEQQNQA